VINTIISPAAILASSNFFYFWNQEGCKSPTIPGRLRFTNKDGLLVVFFDMEYRNGLYYCSMDVVTVGNNPIWVSCSRAQALTLSNTNCLPSKFIPTSIARQVESKVWMLCLGSPGEYQLDVLPNNVINMPAIFEYHPFQLINFKEQAYIYKMATQQTAESIPTCGAKFFINFAFMHSSRDNYKRPNKSMDQIVTSYHGYSAHLIIVDSASQWVWAFLTKSKDPPINILRTFMSKFGIGDGVIRTDQGSKLAHSNSFCDIMLKEFGYVVEPTGANSPSQNGRVERYNNTLPVKVRTLLYGA
jgi:hypothetical protein